MKEQLGKKGAAKWGGGWREGGREVWSADLKAKRKNHCWREGGSADDLKIEVVGGRVRTVSGSERPTDLGSGI